MSVIPEAVEYNIGHLPTSMLMSLVVWAILFALSLAAARRPRLVPGAVQNALEFGFEYLFSLADAAIGPAAPRYYPLCLGIFLFILASNLVGLVPGFVSSTSDLNTTAALAVIVFVYYNVEGIRAHGLRYFAHFFGPPLPWYMFPIRLMIFVIEVISSFARPFSLALRLFCNIFSKEILLGLLAFLLFNFLMGHGIMEKSLMVAPLLLRPFIILLGVVVGLIQALVFLILTVSYIGGAVQAHEQ